MVSRTAHLVFNGENIRYGMGIQQKKDRGEIWSDENGAYLKGKKYTRYLTCPREEPQLLIKLR